MNKTLLTLLFSLFFFAFGHSQTANELKLAKSIQSYNELSEFATTLFPGKTTDEDLKKVRQQSDKIIADLDALIPSESGSTLKCMQYFRVMTRKIYAEALDYSGASDKAFSVYSEIEKQINAYSEGDFPMRYTKDGKNYIIKFDNFAPDQGEFQGKMAEFYYGRKEMGKAKVYARQAAQLSYSAAHVRYAALTLLLILKEEQKELDAEAVNTALKGMELVSKFDEDMRKVVIDNNYLQETDFYEKIEKLIAKKPELSKNGAVWAEAAQCLAAHEPATKSKALTRALQEKYGDRAFCLDAIAHLKSYPDPALGKALMQRWESISSSADCTDLEQLAALQRDYAEKSVAENTRKKAEKCRKDEEKARKDKADADRKAARKASRESGFYLGLYMIPLATTYNRYRDYGGVMDIKIKKTILEFSFLPIRQNYSINWDLVFQGDDAASKVGKRFWDGYYAHFGINKLREKQSYIGALFGYSQQNYSPILADISTDAGQSIPGQSFEPQQKQVYAMLNIGGHSSPKLGFDMYFSIGANYNWFDGGNETYWNKPEYTVSNPLLELRKPNFFMPMIRMGFTMGLNFGDWRN